MKRYCAGENASKIAADLGLSVSTVQVHMQRVRAKLGAATMPQAAVIFDRLQNAGA